jgi:hypothetical protein
MIAVATAAVAMRDIDPGALRWLVGLAVGLALGIPVGWRLRGWVNTLQGDLLTRLVNDADRKAAPGAPSRAEGEP